MADPKGPESGGGSKGGHGARPRSPTLDLSANDVTPKDAGETAAKGAEDGAKSASPSSVPTGAAKAGPSASASASSAASSSGLGQPAPADGAKASAAASPAAKASDPKASDPKASDPKTSESKASDPKAPDSRTSEAGAAASKAADPKLGERTGAPDGAKASVAPVVEPARRDGVGVVGVFAAAIAGAAIAVLVVAVFGRQLIRAPEPDMRRVAAAESKLDSVGRDVAALNQKLGALAESTDMSAIGSKLGELDGRLAELGKTIEASNGRVAAVEDQLKSLSDKVDDPPPDPAIGVLAGRVEGLELKTQTLPAAEELAVLGSRLENVERRAAEAAGKADLAALAARLDGVGRTIGEATKPLADRVEKLAAAVEARPEGDPAARMVVALGALDRALQEGRPFAPELAAVKAASGGNAELSRLDASAASGVPTRDALGAELATILAGLPPLKEQPTGSVFDRFVANAGGIVKITPKDVAEGTDPAAIRAKLGEFAEAGDVEQALALRGKLDEAARAATDDWANKATARVAAENAVGAARTAALARLTAND